METLVKQSPFSSLPNKFCCIECDYFTSRKSQYTRHLSTDKHQWKSFGTNKVQDDKYKCICGLHYKHKSGLYKHKKKCGINIPVVEPDPLPASATTLAQQPPNSVILSNEVILQLINQNKELQMMLIEQNNKMCELAQNQNTNMINNNSNNTTNNTQFNLNVFLNETCKDALNISEFVESLDVKLSDLEETGRLGYSEGISKIFIKGLKELEIHKRPIHCSDFKREVLYVKENNVWEKEDEGKSRITLAIKQVGHKNVRRIMEWQKLHPEYSDPNSKQCSQFNKLLSNVMSGSTVEEQTDNVNKIIKNVTREVVINKKGFG